MSDFKVGDRILDRIWPGAPLGEVERVDGDVVEVRDDEGWAFRLGADQVEKMGRPT